MKQRPEKRNWRVALRPGLPEKIKPLAKESKMTGSEWTDETIHRAVKAKTVYRKVIQP